MHDGTRLVLGWCLIGLGLLLMLVGFVFALLPGHLGIPVLVIGLILLLRNAYWARRRFIKLKRRHPNWVMPVRKLLRRNPPVVSVMWQQLLRTERLLLRRRHQLAGLRRRHFRRTTRIL